MHQEDSRKDPLADPKRRPSQVLLIAIAVAVAAVVTLIAVGFLRLAEMWNARPLGM